MGTGVDLGGYGIEGGVDVADAVIGLKILYGLGVVGGVVVAAESGLASAGDLATIKAAPMMRISVTESSWPSCWR